MTRAGRRRGFGEPDPEVEAICRWVDQELGEERRRQMEEKRFNELLAGPLYDSLVVFQLTKLITALRAVVNATGEQGAKALEEHCEERELEEAYKRERKRRHG